MPSLPSQPQLTWNQGDGLIKRTDSPIIRAFNLPKLDRPCGLCGIATIFLCSYIYAQNFANVRTLRFSSSAPDAINAVSCSSFEFVFRSSFDRGIVSARSVENATLSQRDCIIKLCQQRRYRVAVVLMRTSIQLARVLESNPLFFSLGSASRKVSWARVRVSFFNASNLQCLVRDVENKSGKGNLYKIDEMNGIGSDGQ